MADKPKNLKDRFRSEDLSPAYMRAAYDYWSSVRGKTALPPVCAIDPISLPTGCLPYIVMVEVESEPLRFRSRLNGTKVVEAFGIDQTGRYYNDMPGMTEQLTRFEWCVRNQRPYLGEGTITFAPHDFHRYRTLGLPFGDEERGVQRILFVFDFLTTGAGGNAWAR